VYNEHCVWFQPVTSILPNRRTHSLQMPTNSALLDSGSVEIPGLWGNTVTDESLDYVGLYFYFIKQKVTL